MTTKTATCMKVCTTIGKLLQFSDFAQDSQFLNLWNHRTCQSCVGVSCCTPPWSHFCLVSYLHSCLFFHHFETCLFALQTYCDSLISSGLFLLHLFFHHFETCLFALQTYCDSLIS